MIDATVNKFWHIEHFVISAGVFQLPYSWLLGRMLALSKDIITRVL